jgi:hypothetical protein
VPVLIELASRIETATTLPELIAIRAGWQISLRPYAT